MKNKKWLTYTLGILLTIVVLAAVGGAGFRIGMMQNTSFARAPFAHNFVGVSQPMQGNLQDNSGPHQPTQGDSQNNSGNQSAQGNDNPQPMQRNLPNNGRPQGMPGNARFQGFDDHGNMPFFPHIFGLIHLAVLGLLVWLGYKFVKNSGWRIVRVATSPAPSTAETSSVEVEEKKASE
jgi:hypothetical protein